MNLEKILRKGIIGLGLIATIGLPLRISAQEIPKKYFIPEKFDNYREHTPIVYHFMMGDYLVEARDYDIDGDGKFDVGELFLVGNESNQPLFYGFDLNENGTFDNDEVLGDPSLDDLNGNEEWIFPKGKIA